MNEEEIASAYRDAAKLHGFATRRGDSKVANKCYKKISQAHHLIEKMGPEGAVILFHLMGDEDESVSCWAATHYLRIDESRALEVLMRLSDMSGIIAFGAKMVIQQWNEGKLR